ncbi:S8 family serine peptidase [Micromonospora sp. CPCC 205561]|uniref:S8 family serine peptidase n=1 Tax=Micromonospora sp. CPCC 205561 TaxID=3122407 RepID=UPI002FF191F2
MAQRLHRRTFPHLGRAPSRLAAAVVASAMLIAVAPAPGAAAPPRAPLPGGERTPEPPARPAAGRPQPKSGLWLLRMDKPSVVAAARSSAARAGGIDPRSAASTSYSRELARQQDTLVDEIEATLGRSVRVAHRYRNVVNGMAVAVSADEAAQLSGLPGVAAVVPDEVLALETDTSNALIQSPAVWEGRTAENVGTRGEGAVVGVLDSGINPEHPSFAAVDGDGYRHTNPLGEGRYVGVCAPTHPQHRAICNDKLIGAWAMVGTDARDDNGHGSHTASTAAGNRHEATIAVGAGTHKLTVSGVAPRANIISYKVCMSIGCLSSATVAAVDQAIADGVDVLNYSISGRDDPWNDVVDQAFLEAYSAGIFVAASAGNSGPGPGTVAKTAPWNMSVAAVSHERVVAHRLAVTSPTPVPAALTGVAAVPGEGSPSPPIQGEMRYSGTVDADNEQGCAPFPAGVFGGRVALIPRGGCDFSVKVRNAATAGATGVVVHTQYGGPPITMGALAGTPVPAVMIGLADGQRLRAHLAATDGPVSVRVDAGSEVLRDEDWTDVVADFSARGSSRFDMLAPTVAAPGRNILAATMATKDDPAQYAFMQGTSMASPHVAGAGALLAALHPDWSPTRIRSALAVTADRDGVVKEDSTTPADPFDIGSGRINVGQAARTGLVLDETAANFAAADPEAGGDPQTLNLPAVVEHHCLKICTFTRTVTSVAEGAATYRVASRAPVGTRMTVAPTQFTLAPGASQDLTVTLDVTGTTRGNWLFGAVDLTTDARHSPDGQPIAQAHFPVAVLPAAPDLTLDRTELSSSMDVARSESHTVTVGNAGGAELTWRATGDGPGCAWPSWAKVTPAQGTLAAFKSQQILITLDSTGLDDGGVFRADLCVTSNDQDRPTARIALELTVVPVPKIEVAPRSLTARQPAGLVTTRTFAVRNSGHGVLDWRLDDPDAGPGDERIRLLRDGVLLIPNSATATRGVMAFDPHSGKLIDAQFVPHHPYNPSSSLYTPFQIVAKPDGSGFLMSDQVTSMITEYGLDGSFRRVFAPTDGVRDPAIMTNTRGMALSPRGTVLVTVATQGNANSVVEFDADGRYLGTYVAPGADGLKGPWGILFRGDDMLVSASDSDAIHSFTKDGSRANPRFFEGLSWPGQLAELPNGNVLAASWGSGSTAGVWEMDRAGKLLGVYAPPGGSGYQGVHPLGNGNILTTSSKGVHEIDRTGRLVEVENDKGAARFITHIRLPDLQPCVTPDEVPWLSVSRTGAGTGAGRSTEVTVSLDSAGLAAGTYRAQLCVTSDDPANPLETLPVTLEVTDQTCGQVVSGERRGPLPVRAGVTCLAPGARVFGPVDVGKGASLIALDAAVSGPVTATGAAVVELTGSRVDGPLSVTGATGRVAISGMRVSGPVSLVGSRTGGTPAVVAGNRIDGPLSCVGNQPPPVNNGMANTVGGPRSGQCARL